MLRSRYRQIVLFFGKLTLKIIFWDIFLAKIGFGERAAETRSARYIKMAIQFRNLATEMGGVMIKVGQFLSTRVDVLPPEITKELANLQDEVLPEPFEAIRAVAELELGCGLDQQYLEFRETPLAAASLGQVHLATLHQPENGIQAVVVKVQRPNIENIIKTDLAALKTVGRWLQRYRPIAKRANIPSLMREFSAITLQEVDYLLEGKNAETFAANFANRPGIKVPKVIWSHTTQRVLTLENVQAIKITDYEAITAAHIHREQVAQRLFETYLQQIFEDGFFHADPHPGNLFVAPIAGSQSENPAWTLTFVDFGMVGRVPPHIRAGLREMAIGVGLQDSNRIIKSYQMLGVLLPDADLKLLEQVEERAFERFWGKSMAELQNIGIDELNEFASEFRDILYEMPFQMPENLIFLGRCVAILSGMCTGLNSDFNVWLGLAPFAKQIIQEETLHGFDFWKDEIGDIGRAMINLPRRVDQTLRKIERGDMVVDTPQLNRYAGRLEKTGQRMIHALIFATFFFSGIQLYLAHQPQFGVGLLIVALIPLWRVIFWRR